MDFRSSFSPPMGRIFENPERVSVGTVAITATVLARLISHDPVAISALVQDKVVDARPVSTLTITYDMFGHAWSRSKSLYWAGWSGCEW